MSTGNIKVNILDGRRNWLPSPHEVLLRFWRDGTKLAHERFYNANSITVTFEVNDNLSDQFRIVAFCDGHEQAGFHPVNLVKGETTVFLMLIGKDAKFDFNDAKGDKLADNAPQFAELLGRIPDAGRFQVLVDDQPACAAMLNITTAMNDIPLPKHMLRYFKSIIWDNIAKPPLKPTNPQPDRFYGFVEPALKTDIIALGNQFTEEKDPASKGHPGATKSFKQNLLGEANIQITFHENHTDSSGNIKAEVDIDLFSDPLAHFFLEVVPNKITNGKTDPKAVYVLRWMAARHKGLPFSPPYRLS